MNTEIEEILDAVEYINDRFLSQATDYYHLSFFTNGWIYGVEFLGQVMWTSEDDMRWEDDNGNKESFISYLLQEVQAEISKLNAIKFYEDGDVEPVDVMFELNG